jgi:hypothetical protein
VQGKLTTQIQVWVSGNGTGGYTPPVLFSFPLQSQERYVTTLDFDPLATGAGKGLLMDPQTHLLLPDGYFLGALKKALRRDNLFLYFHRHTRNFVIASWLRPPRATGARLCMEVEALPFHPDFGPISFPEMYTRLSMTMNGQMEHMKRKLLRAHREKQDIKDHSLEERNSVVKFLRNKDMALTAHLIDTGQMPWLSKAMGGKHMEQVREEMQGMADLDRRRTYAHSSQSFKRNNRNG